MSTGRAQKFKPRTIRLVGAQQLATAHAALDNVPLELGLEVVIREEQRVRGLDANSRMWAGPLADIAEQAYIGGRQFSAEVWHEFFKKEFLPEEDAPDLELMVKDPEKWKKWDFDPDGERICVGTTTQLTKRGFAIYMEKIMAYGAALGVMFSASPREYES